MHARPPAFGGSDGQPYSVSTFVDPAPDAEGRFGAALLFLCWGGGEGSERPVGHLETDYLAFGRTPDEALVPLLALSLGDVKKHLDHCIALRASSGSSARHCGP
ncbi:MAG: hypothetical protein ACREL9_08625 [Gemmatimonadales bacterium]